MNDKRELARYYEQAIADTMISLSRMLKRYLHTYYPSPSTRLHLNDLTENLNDTGSWLIAEEDVVPLGKGPTKLLVDRAKCLTATLEAATKTVPHSSNQTARALRQLCIGSRDIIQEMLKFIDDEAPKNG